MITEKCLYDCRSTIPTGVIVARRKWTHLDFVVDTAANNLRVYQKGKLVFSKQSVNIPFTSGNKISISAGGCPYVTTLAALNHQ